jgi:hypothetical protein
MILLCENIAWVQADDGRATPFDESRLYGTLSRAALSAGYRDWWFGEAVTIAVREFVCAHCERQTVAASTLAGLVEGVLRALGFADVAEAYRRRHECAEVRLDEIADNDGALSELEFFRRLDAALGTTRNVELALVHVRGLRLCVMRLRGAQYWSATCRRFADEILLHVRERVARSRRNETGTLCLAVTE